MSMVTDGVAAGTHPNNPTSGRRQVVWTFFASAVVALSACYASFSRRPGPITCLPASYALCAQEQRIYTVDLPRPLVDCILVNKHTIAATGTLPQIQTFWNDYQNELIRTFYGNEPSAKKPLPVINVPPGSVVVPGLTDAHAHILQYGFKMQLRLDQASTLSELLDLLENYTRSHPSNPDTWVEAMGWDQTRWADTNGTFPTSADLASRPSLASLPIALHRIDVHALWLSPRALVLTKEHLNGTLPDSVPGGEIIRDSTTGEPTGIFVDAAMSLVPIPKWSTSQMREYADRTMKDALAVGLTSIHDAATSLAEFELFQRMDEENALPIRIYAMADSDRISPDEKQAIDIHDPSPAAHVRMRSVKLFTDGALGSWGAALLAPYSDNAKTRGLMRLPEDALEKLVRDWWDMGWGINVHAIGDRANKAVLDAFEKIANASGNKGQLAERRPRIEHAQIMRVEDLKRPGELGGLSFLREDDVRRLTYDVHWCNSAHKRPADTCVSASSRDFADCAQADSALRTSDMWYAETRLGPERINGAYAYQTLLKLSQNGILPLGSDFPVEGINPLLGFYAAVARLDAEGRSPHGEGGWFPSERLTRAQALKGMTLDAAYASFAEDTLGSLVPGKRADFVILDRNIMDESRPFSEILETRVRATVVDGKVAFGGI
ncbi:amidohydrolase family-domain-containing protein [Trametes punicea]|nr:amidohydrolase family-domain-containing protein [Trametes punicea]